MERSDRKRAPRPFMRVGCLATFSIRYDRKLKKYVVTHFVKEYNHSFVASQCMPFHRLQKSVKDPDKAHDQTANPDVGVKTSQIHDAGQGTFNSNMDQNCKH